MFVPLTSHWAGINLFFWGEGEGWVLIKFLGFQSGWLFEVGAYVSKGGAYLNKKSTDLIIIQLALGDNSKCMVPRNII